MKRIALFAALAAVAAAGCGQPVIKYIVPCASRPVGDSFSALENLVRPHGLVVVDNDLEDGVLRMQYTPIDRYWQFQVTDSTIEAIAYEIHTERVYSSISNGWETRRKIKYFDEGTFSDQYWFWNVRKGLDSVCEGRAVMVRD